MEHISQIINHLGPQESQLSVDDVILTTVNKDNWLSDSGIPLRYRDKTLEGFRVLPENKNAYSNCMKYVTEFPTKLPIDYYSLGLFSKVWGVGKTHLVCAIAKKLIERCRYINPVLYVTEPNMLRRIRQTFNHRDETETEDDILSELTTAPLLIIDDVGKEEVADPRFVQRIWFSIINERYDNLLPVIITANLNPDEIAHHLGGSRNNDASFDRLYEMMRGIFYELKGESHRRNKWNNTK